MNTIYFLSDHNRVICENLSMAVTPTGSICLVDRKEERSFWLVDLDKETEQGCFIIPENVCFYPSLDDANKAIAEFQKSGVIEKSFLDSAVIIGVSIKDE